MSEQQPMPGPTAPAGYKTLAEAAARFAQRLRYTHAKAEHRLARDIGDGRLALWTLPGMARLVPAADQTLDFARSEVNWPASTIYVDLGDDGSVGIAKSPNERVVVVIDEDDIERLLDELAPPAASAAPPPAATHPAPGPSPASTARPQGRPAEYDWALVKTQVWRRVYRYGLPEKSSVIVFEVLNLLSRNPPEQRTVERYIAKCWPDLEALWKEIGGPCEITPVSNDRQK